MFCSVGWLGHICLCIYCLAGGVASKTLVVPSSYVSVYRDMVKM
jgi:hypothetical protein